jgi:uncharacterized cupredoxin-like copper-binding protein
MRGHVKLAVLGAAVAVVLAGGSTVAMAAASGAFSGNQLRPDYRYPTVNGPVCTAPGLPGAVIDVTLADMGGHMAFGHGGMMGNGSGQMMSGGWGVAGMMIVRVSPTSAAPGTVSLRVGNVGAARHELVVLPLATDARPGQRAVGTDGTVAEAGSLGEASNNCGADAGNGILPGAEGWTTIQLAAGSYELLCNLPGHYAAGMYAELDVTGS